jgi:phospholipid transport system substrate-binding protein
MQGGFRAFRGAAIAALGACFCFLSAFAGPARADDAAKAYVAGVLEEANPVLALTDAEARLAGVDALVRKHVDMNRVAMFVLGAHARDITPAQRQEYLALFRDYAMAMFRDVLLDYSGEMLEVTGAVTRAERDIIVNSRVANARPGDSGYGVVVHWRIYRSPDGEMRVFDAGADGMWLAVEQRDQFGSFISRAGGGVKGIDAMIADLRTRLQ